MQVPGAGGSGGAAVGQGPGSSGGAGAPHPAAPFPVPGAPQPVKPLQPAAPQAQSTFEPAQFDFEDEPESDIATTEVWQVSVAKTPNHSSPFVIEMPRDELEEREAAKAAAMLANDLAAASKYAPSAPIDDIAKPASETDTPASFNIAASDVQAPVEFSAFDDDVEDDEDESPTIVATIPLDDDDEEEDSPTMVVVRERYVLVRDEDGQRTELEPPCILGRGKAADKRVKGNLAISRKHAKLFKEDGKLLIQDLGSTNGTFVDGLELEGDQCVPVDDGTVIRLGTEDFTFHIEPR